MGPILIDCSVDNKISYHLEGNCTVRDESHTMFSSCGKRTKAPLLSSYPNGLLFFEEHSCGRLEVSYRDVVLKYIALLGKTEANLQLSWFQLAHIHNPPTKLLYIHHIPLSPILLIWFNGPPSCRIACRNIRLCRTRQCHRTSICPFRVPILVPVPCI